MAQLPETVGLVSSNYLTLLTEGIWTHYLKKDRTDHVVSCQGVDFKVHQLMMSIFAPRILEMCQNDPSFLKDIHSDNFTQILEFIYRGRVNVMKTQVNSLRQSAQKLDIKPLVDAIDKYYFTCEDKPTDDLHSDGFQRIITVQSPPDEDDSAENSISKSDDLVQSDAEEKVDSETEMTESNLVLEKGPNRGRWVISCPHCSFEAGGQKTLMRHLLTDHGVHIKTRLKIPYKCETCDFTCFIRKVLTVHRKTNHSNLKCPHCEFTAHRKGLLNRHVSSCHSSDRPFPCKHCDYRAKCSTDLYAHQSTHLDEKFVCHICSKTLGSRRTYRVHMRIHQNPEVYKKPYRCQFCSLRFWHKYSLGNHLNSVHNYEQPKEDARLKRMIPDGGWRCSLCDYKTHVYVRWTDHLAIKHKLDTKGNSLEPKITCGICDFTCLVHSQMRSHMKRSHSDRFRCEHCSYSSYNKTQVSYHMKAKHFQDKAFMCETCGSRFGTEFHLGRHVRTHGINKFCCEICNKSFALNSYLGKHMRLMHDEFAKKQMCHMCAFVTKTKDALNQHMKRMHKDLFEDAIPPKTNATSETICI